MIPLCILVKTILQNAGEESNLWAYKQAVFSWLCYSGFKDEDTAPNMQESKQIPKKFVRDEGIAWNASICTGFIHARLLSFSSFKSCFFYRAAIRCIKSLWVFWPSAYIKTRTCWPGVACVRYYRAIWCLDALAFPCLAISVQTAISDNFFHCSRMYAALTLTVCFWAHVCGFGVDVRALSDFQVVESPFLEVFKTWLDMSLGKRSWLGQVTSRGPSQPLGAYWDRSWQHEVLRTACSCAQGSMVASRGCGRAASNLALSWVRYCCKSSWKLLVVLLKASRDLERAFTAYTIAGLGSSLSDRFLSPKLQREHEQPLLIYIQIAPLYCLLTKGVFTTARLHVLF